MGETGQRKITTTNNLNAKLDARKLTKLRYSLSIEYTLFTVDVVFAGKLICSMNVLYIELSYTGSLDRSSITVQICYAC